MRIILRRFKYLVIAWILAFSVTLYADIITIDGNVKSVDAKARTITVMTGTNEKTLDVSSKAKIIVEGKEGSFDSLKPGQNVTLSFHDQLEVVVKIEVITSSTTLLFDGKTLNGWTTPDGKKITGWKVDHGELVLLGEKNTPLLMTTDRFDDFQLECDFRMGPKSNSGIFLRGRYELQLLDDEAYKKFRPNQLCGAVYGQLAPSKSVYLGANQWNSLVVKLKGKQITVFMNDTKIIDDRTLDGVTSGAIDDQENLPGPIVLQSHTGSARFRNIRVSSLKE